MRCERKQNTTKQTKKLKLKTPKSAFWKKKKKKEKTKERETKGKGIHSSTDPNKTLITKRPPW